MLGRNRVLAVSVLAAVFAFSSMAWADLSGSSVTGSLTFPPSSTDYFNATATIPDPTTFDYSDGQNKYQAQWSASLLDIIYTCGQELCNMPSWTMTFMDSALLGATITENATPAFYNPFSPTFSLSGSTLTISLDGSTMTPTAIGNQWAVEYQITTGQTAPVPEPSSLLLLGTGLISVGSLLRRKFSGR